MCVPGAARSGMRMCLSPLLAKLGVFHPDPVHSAAPTASTNGSIAGLATVCMALPSLPTAPTTTMPALHARSTAYDNGSMLYDWFGFTP